MWVRCGATACGAHLHVSELAESLNVCPRCGQHFRLSAPERIAQLADEGSFEEHGADWGPVDPLHFVSAGVSYHEKVGATRRATGLPEAIVCGSARIGGRPVEMAVMDFRFLGGSMGTVVGEKLVRTLDRATGRCRPVVVVSCSGGARMHEGMLSLMQMARTAAAVARLHQAGLPLLSVLTDPTTGGVAASFAGLGDVLIAEPGALIGFAGPRVVEQVTRQKLPPGAQRAELQLRSCLVTLLRLYTDTGRKNHATD
jgi:acetyl-CoA carboxylase carboxyl transferase subunit beta